MRTIVAMVILSVGLAPVALAQNPPCQGNLLKNGTFAAGVTVVGNGSMPASLVDSWSAASRDPQVVSAGACDAQFAAAGACGTAGFIAMWGNQAVGEAIRQTLAQPLEPEKAYRFSACVRYPNPSAAGPVRIKVRMSNGPLPNFTSPGVTVGVTPDITSDQWIRVTLPDWKPPFTGLNTITISPENQYAVDDGAKVSWAHVDNICLTPVDVPQSVYTTIGACEKGNGCQKCCACSDHNGQNCTAYKRVLW
jgi:hypothetical protein